MSRSVISSSWSRRLWRWWKMMVFDWIWQCFWFFGRLVRRWRLDGVFGGSLLVLADAEGCFRVVQLAVLVEWSIGVRGVVKPCKWPATWSFRRLNWLIPTSGGAFRLVDGSGLWLTRYSCWVVELAWSCWRYFPCFFLLAVVCCWRRRWEETSVLMVVFFGSLQVCKEMLYR